MEKNKEIYIVVARFTHEVWKVFDSREKAIKGIGYSPDYEGEVGEVE